MLDKDVFARYLDLTPLNGRPNGLVRCIFHHDFTPSLSVDLDAGIFNCFGCGEQGGIKRFAELVGDTPASDTSKPEETVAMAGLRLAKRAKWSQETVWRSYELADWIRHTRRVIADIRAQARDDLDAWDLLTKAAALETTTNHLEAELDAIAFGRRL